MAKQKHATLVASTVTTITLDSAVYEEIVVVNRTGANEIYFTVDGSTPTVGGDNTFVVPAAAGASTALTIAESAVGTVVVKLISDGAEEFSLMGV